MPDYPINLGKPEGGRISYPVAMPSSPPSMYYPCTHIDLPEGVELPDSGTITFRFRTDRVTEDRKQDRCCADIELLSIEALKADKSDKGSEYGGDALDKLRAEVESASEDAGEPGEE